MTRTIEIEPQDSVIVRQIDEDSWWDYAIIRREMLLSDPDAFPPQAFADLDNPEEKWRERIRQSDVLLAYDHERPIGMIRVTYEDKAEDDKAMLRNMYTNAEYRGQGLGKRLMTSAMEIIASREIPVVELEVEDTQLAAQTMYAKFGFSEISRVPNERDGFMITMRKTIDDSYGLGPGMDTTQTV